MPITNKATITQWNSEKDFGFATANGVKYFLHISALEKSAREPQVGDTITVYSFGKSPKGPRIEKGALDGVPSSATHTTVALLARPLEETNACGSSCYAYA